MNWRFATTAAALLALTGCASTTTPVTEEIFIAPPATETPMPTTVQPLPEAGETTVEPIPTGPDPALAMVEEDPNAVTFESVTSGLTERMPNTCKLENYRYLEGQTAAQVESMGLGVPYRVIQPDGIVSQEYNPLRVNFYLGQNGNVERVTCG